MATQSATSVTVEQVALVEALESLPMLKRQMGEHAYRELIDIAMQLGDVARVNSIWIDTLYPRVLVAIERARPDVRPAIGRVRQVLEARRYSGRRVTSAERREDARFRPWDTLEEKRGER